jgi:hypothetical protein
VQLQFALGGRKGTMNAAEIRTVSDLCISSADSSFVFGGADSGVWHFVAPAAGRIVCPADPKIRQELEPTMRTGHLAVHITLDCDGQMYHGTANVIRLDPKIELEIVDGLVPA